MTLVAHELEKTYGDLVALHDVSLTFEPGETVALVGINGAGKSTFLRLAAGLLEPTGGLVMIDGFESGTIGARAACSFVGDQPALYDDLSLREHIEFVAAVHGCDGWPPLADELVDALNLSGRIDDMPARFSRGLRQKTALVLGLARPFSVLLVDEPFVGLDPAGQATLVELLHARAAAGAAVVVATHQLTYLEHVTRVVALRDGAVRYSGPPGSEHIQEWLD